MTLYCLMQVMMLFYMLTVRRSTIGTLQDADDDNNSNNHVEQEEKHQVEITRLTHQVISLHCH